MNKITKFTPESEILKELAKRMRQIRKAKGYTQVELAAEAGIGIATLRRIESGQDSNLISWLKLLKVLEMITAIDQLLPNTFNSPMANILGEKIRKRKKTSFQGKFTWGDEVK